MKSLTEDLRSNREQATKLMKDNNISHICFRDIKAYGTDLDTPFVLLINKNGEPYETEVTDVKLCEEEIYIKVVNMTDLCSNAYVDKEGYIDYFICEYYTANNVYIAIEDYFENELYFGDKIAKLDKEIEGKFFKLLSDEDERTFTFEDCDMFRVDIGTNGIDVKNLYIEDNRVVLETNTKLKPNPNATLQTFPLSGICLEEKFNLLKHLKNCLKDKC